MFLKGHSYWYIVVVCFLRYQAFIPYVQTWNAPSPTSFLSWEVADFSFDPVLRRTYVASLSGPYYATFEDPFTWVSIRTGFPSPSNSYEATTQRILIDPSSSGQRLLAFGGNKRGWPRLANLGVVWESLDAGSSWAVLSNISEGGNILFADWCGSACIWAAVNQAGMFRSDDGGRTWTNRSAGLNTDFAFAEAAAHPSDPDTAYAAMSDGSGVWKTINGGTAWLPINSGLPTGGGRSYEAFGLAPSSPSTLYAGNSADAGNAWVSVDAGNTWIQTASPPAAQAYGLGMQASVLSVHPSDPESVFYGTWVTLWRSSDGGQTWRDATAFQPPNSTDSNTWSGTGFSGLVSTNVKCSPFAAGPHPQRCFIQGMDAGKLWAATDAGLGAWRRQQGLNEFGGGNDVSFGADGLTMYAATGQWGWPTMYSTEGVTLSTDGGDSFSYVCGHPNISGTVLANSVYTMPFNTSSVWAVFGGVYCSALHYRIYCEGRTPLTTPCLDNRAYFSSDSCYSWTLLERCAGIHTNS